MHAGLTGLSKVSIPQWCDCYMPRRLPSSTLAEGFNPTMVRLLLPLNKATAEFFKVSIPQWCDCYRAPTASKAVASEFQSHNGAIATTLQRIAKKTMI